LGPFEEAIAQLTTSQNLAIHCNGQGIPQENCLAVCAMRGPAMESLKFAHETQNSEMLMFDFAKSIVDLVRIGPHAIMVFFISLAYMDLVDKFLGVNELVDRP
jgi:hypothetical protein